MYDVPLEEGKSRTKERREGTKDLANERRQATNEGTKRPAKERRNQRINERTKRYEEDTNEELTKVRRPLTNEGL